MTGKRGIKTLIGSFFRKRGQSGAMASNASFLVSLAFVAALFCAGLVQGMLQMASEGICGLLVS